MGDRRENEALALRALAALNNKDIAALQDCLHPDVVWNETGAHNPLGGPYEGMGEMLSFLAGVFEGTGDTFTVELHDLLASDDHAVLLVHETAVRGSRNLDDRGLYVLHFADGKISEVWSYSEDQAAHDAFWSYWT